MTNGSGGDAFKSASFVHWNIKARHESNVTCFQFSDYTNEQGIFTTIIYLINKGLATEIHMDLQDSVCQGFQDEI